MKEYYQKPELTKKTKINGWICTGDLADIDEKGFVYIWGRCKDTVSVSGGAEIYLFDVANKIKEKKYIDDAIVLPLPDQAPVTKLAAHIVWAEGITDDRKASCLEDLNETLKDYLPKPLTLWGYAEHQGMLPYSPTTLKKDRNRMYQQKTGFYQVCSGKLAEVTLKE